MSIFDWMKRVMHPRRNPPVPAPHPVPKPVPPPIILPPVVTPKRCLYFIASEWLLAAKQPAEYWKDMGFTGLVTMVDDAKERALFNLAFSPIALRDQMLRVRDAAGDMELFVSHWSQNNYPPYGPNKQLVPWDDDPAWDEFCVNLSVLSHFAHEVRAAGILMDAEYYPQIGTFQNPAIAWTGHPRVPERAIQWARALRSAAPFILGNYVTYHAVDLLKGYIPWWRAVETEAPGSLMLPEDGFTRLGLPEASYAANRRIIKMALGCESLGAVGIDSKLMANGVPQARFPVAVKESPAGVWVFPWDSQFLSDPTAPQVAWVRKMITGRY